MNVIRTLIVSVLLAGILGCSSVTVRRDYDTSFDFSKLKTFGWLSPPKQTPEYELAYKRVKKALAEQLEGKGFRQDLANPDFTIAVLIGQQTKKDVVDWGYSYGWYDGYYGAGLGTRRVDVYEYEEGTLDLDFVEAKTNQLIWRGVAQRVVDDGWTPEKREMVINEAVAKMLEKFPPAE